jgi:hypothetical protein
MDELDHDHSQHFRQFAGDEKLYKMFYKGLVPNEEASAEQGRPIFREVIMIKIITPGNRDNIVDREMQPHDKIRFRETWARFEKGEHELGTGTPLAEWPLVSRSMAEELKFFGFFSVEHVAEANDAVMSKMPGLRELSGRAKAWLTATKDTEGTAKALKENEDLKSQIAALTAQVADLAKMAVVPPNAQPVANTADSTGGIDANKKSK